MFTGHYVPRKIPRAKGVPPLKPPRPAAAWKPCAAIDDRGEDGPVATHSRQEVGRAKSRQTVGQADRVSAHRRRSRAVSREGVRRPLDASRLLAALARSHGLIASKYEVTKGRDGSDRIQCGVRNRNASAVARSGPDPA